MDTPLGQNDILKQEYMEYFRIGISYLQYKVKMEEDFHSNKDETIKSYIKLNQSRMHRVEKTYSLSEAIINQLKGLKHKTNWLVLTEHWCGDAAQCLPVFDAVAEASNGMIAMKLVYRDEQEKLMNAYLTNESRSIPKLIQLDKHFNVKGYWGPRPNIAQMLVKALKSNPETTQNYGNQLHLWYANDKQKEIEMEIGKLLFRANLFCPDCIS